MTPEYLTSFATFCTQMEHRSQKVEVVCTAITIKLEKTGFESGAKAEFGRQA